MLDLTQSDSGSLLLAEEKVDLKRLCTEAAAACHETAEAKRIDFAVEIGTGLGTVTGDASACGSRSTMC